MRFYIFPGNLETLKPNFPLSLMSAQQYCHTSPLIVSMNNKCTHAQHFAYKNHVSVEDAETGPLS